MKTLIKALICLLEFLQKFPYKEVIDYLKQKLLNEDSYSSNTNLPKAQITIKKETVLINGIKIVDAKAKLSYIIFVKLIETHISDTLRGTFTPLNVNEISKLLEKSGIVIFDIENQIRRQISRLREIMRNKLDFSQNDVINTIRNSGIGDKSFGYILNLENVTFVTQTLDKN